METQRNINLNPSYFIYLMRGGCSVMSSAFQSEIGAARLERAAILAGESFAFAIDDEPAATPPTGIDRHWGWVGMIAGLSIVVTGFMLFA